MVVEVDVSRMYRYADCCVYVPVMVPLCVLCMYGYACVRVHHEPVRRRFKPYENARQTMVGRYEPGPLH